MKDPAWLKEIAEEYCGYAYEMEVLLDGKQTGDVIAIIQLVAHIRELRDELLRLCTEPVVIGPHRTLLIDGPDYAVNVLDKRAFDLLSRQEPPEVKP